MNDSEVLNKEIEEGTLSIQWEFSNNVELPEGFEKWFFKHAIHLGKIGSLPNDLKISQTTNNQCFHNSQLISIENKDVLYYEGLMYGPVFKNCIHHGFNYQKEVIDVTYLKNETDFHGENGTRDKYFIYFGVNIPSEFIEKYRAKITKDPNQQNPMLLEYYNSINT